MNARMTWSPSRALARDASLDRLFDDFFAPVGRREGWLPATDVVEAEDHYRLELDLPGFDRKDLHLSVDEGNLIVRGTRKIETSEEKRSFVRNERYAGEFTRTFRLGEAIDAAKISARYENGVLSVTVPKAESAKPREIEVS